MEESLNKGEVIIYSTKEGETFIDVKLQEETVWLSQAQMAELFGKGIPTINEHIKNIFKEGELEEDPTIRKFRTVRKEGKRTVERDIDHYNLDVIISVGYRVKSARGTQFRIWANKVLKEYLIKGYSVNEKRLKEQTKQLKELQQTVKLLSQVTQNYALTHEETSGLLKVITDYAYALKVLDQYDHQSLEIQHTNSDQLFIITYEEAIKAIEELGNKFGASTLFGNEKDESFKGTLGAIYQTFDGKDLYPSIEEKAANLLYFTIKNHSFSDGNKRIAAFLFVWFLERNKYLYREDGEKRIADNALVALCLMLAESKPEEKEIMVKLIVNLINKNN